MMESFIILEDGNLEGNLEGTWVRDGSLQSLNTWWGGYSGELVQEEKGYPCTYIKGTKWPNTRVSYDNTFNTNAIGPIHKPACRTC